jgi:hypothetical protein
LKFETFGGGGGGLSGRDKFEGGESWRLWSQVKNWLDGWIRQLEIIIKTCLQDNYKSGITR